MARTSSKVVKNHYLFTFAIGSGGSTGGSFRGFESGFSFQHAEDIFRNLFGGRDPFASFFDEDEDIFGGFGGMGRGGAGRGAGSK